MLCRLYAGVPVSRPQVFSHIQGAGASATNPQKVPSTALAQPEPRWVISGVAQQPDPQRSCPVGWLLASSDLVALCGSRGLNPQPVQAQTSVSLFLPGVVEEVPMGMVVPVGLRLYRGTFRPCFPRWGTWRTGHQGLRHWSSSQYMALGLCPALRRVPRSCHWFRASPQSLRCRAGTAASRVCLTEQ